jgi:hypothetical protein
VSGRWKDLASKSTRANGSYRFSTTPPAGVQHYRVTKPQSHGHPLLISRVVTVTATWRPTVTVTATPELDADGTFLRIEGTVDYPVSKVLLQRMGAWGSDESMAPIDGSFEFSPRDYGTAQFRIVAPGDGSARLDGVSNVIYNTHAPYSAVPSSTPTHLNGLFVESHAAEVQVDVTQDERVTFIGVSQDGAEWTANVVDPDGHAAGTFSSQAGTHHLPLVTDAGTYTVDVNEQAGDSWDLYVLPGDGVESVVDSNPVAASTGSSGAAMWEIFHGTAGDVVTVNLFADGDHDPDVAPTLHAPSGSTVESTPDAWPVSFVLTETGYYAAEFPPCQNASSCALGVTVTLSANLVS